MAGPRARRRRRGSGARRSRSGPRSRPRGRSGGGSARSASARGRVPGRSATGARGCRGPRTSPSASSRRRPQGRHGGRSPPRARPARAGGRLPRQGPVEPQPSSRGLVGAQPQLVGQERRELMRGRAGVALAGRLEQLARDRRAGSSRGGVDRPELGGDGEQRRGRRRARVVCRRGAPSAGFRCHGIPRSTVGHGIPTEGTQDSSWCPKMTRVGPTSAGKEVVFPASAVSCGGSALGVQSESRSRRRRSSTRRSARATALRGGQQPLARPLVASGVCATCHEGLAADTAAVKLARFRVDKPDCDRPADPGAEGRHCAGRPHRCRRRDPGR